MVSSVCISVILFIVKIVESFKTLFWKSQRVCSELRRLLSWSLENMNVERYANNVEFRLEKFPREA